jgi:LemA protein
MFLTIGGTITIIVVIAVVVLLVAWIVGTYNALVGLRNKVRNGWSQIDVQLKRRFDLIPNLVETVKGYATHEKEIWDQFGKARGLYQQAAQTGDVAKAAEAEKGLAGALSRLLVVQEAYPELKANENFKEMMAQLKDTEDKIMFNRQFYNDTAMNFNNKVEMFPGNIVARMFGFQLAKLFEITSEAEREGVKVKF